MKRNDVHMMIDMTFKYICTGNHMKLTDLSQFAPIYMNTAILQVKPIVVLYAILI